MQGGKREGGGQQMKCAGCRSKIRWYHSTVCKGEFHRRCWKSYLRGYVHGRDYVASFGDDTVEKKIQGSTGEGA